MLLRTSEIRELIRLLDETSVHELNIETEDMKLHIKKANVTSLSEPVQRIEVSHATPVSSVQAVAKESDIQNTVVIESPVSQTTSAIEEGLTVIKSPMVGTFYLAPSPTAQNYVEIGTKVTEKTVVCIVEAMKLMNEIEADVRGEIVEVLAENGHLVEYGQPLFRVKLA